jgi:hypothetical protein
MTLGKVTIAALLATAAWGQRNPTLLDAGYRELYNLDFDAGHSAFQEWERLHPNDPMGPVSDAAAYLFSEFARLHILESEFFIHDQHFMLDNKLTPDPALKRNFDASLALTKKLAAQAPNEENTQFALILAGGLQSDYTALIEKRYAAAYKESKASRVQAERLLARNPQLYDAWLAVGVENYLLGIKPMLVRWVLRLVGGQTDRALGIEKIRITAEKGRYLAPLARLLLVVAALRDGDKSQAHDLLAGLREEFPRNPLYPRELARLDETAKVLK